MSRFVHVSDDRGVGRQLKRWLYLTHRWTGVAACVLFAMWFLTGLVMVYVSFPVLNASERLTGLPAIDWSLVRTSPAQALRTAGVSVPPCTIVLEMRADRPVWQIATAGGGQTDIAADGGVLGDAAEDEARRAAELFSGRIAATQELLMRDQWTVAGGFDRHRPLWKVGLAGEGGRVLYVSSRTGAVVLDTSARERFWNWLGSVPHWLYPTVLRQDNTVWRQVVMWVSGPCIVAAASGLWIGILRTRPGRRRFDGGRMTPYRGWMRWHHVAGLIGGAFVVAWIFSGWLSVDPFRLFARGGIAPEARAAYERPGMPPEIDPIRLARAARGAKRVALRWIAGRPLLIVEHAGRTPVVLDPVTLTATRPPARVVIAAARALVPGASIAATRRLTEPDSYWYGVRERPTLPVLRIMFDDRAGTWVHIDPMTGAVLGDVDARGRLYRWLFDLLHRWDLNVLTRHRPSRDLLIWILSIAGIVTSISGIRIGWTRLAGQPKKDSLYLARLADVDMAVLEDIVRRTHAATGDAPSPGA